MKKKTRFASVWDAIEDTPQQAASMRARSELMIALQGWLKTSDNTQAKAAKLLGITKPRMSDIVRGKISLFSLEALMDMATVAGLEPQLTIKKPKAKRKRREADLKAMAGKVKAPARGVPRRPEDFDTASLLTRSRRGKR